LIPYPPSSKQGGWQRPHRHLHSLPQCIRWNGTNYHSSKPSKDQHNAPLSIINWMLDFSFSCLYQGYGFCKCQYMHKNFKGYEHLHINFKIIHYFLIHYLLLFVGKYWLVIKKVELHKTSWKKLWKLWSIFMHAYPMQYYNMFF
jgi:hypothetical protein